MAPYKHFVYLFTLPEESKPYCIKNKDSEIFYQPLMIPITLIKSTLGWRLSVLSLPSCLPLARRKNCFCQGACFHWRTLTGKHWWPAEWETLEVLPSPQFLNPFRPTWNSKFPRTDQKRKRTHKHNNRSSFWKKLDKPKVPKHRIFHTSEIKARRTWNNVIFGELRGGEK